MANREGDRSPAQQRNHGTPDRTSDMSREDRIGSTEERGAADDEYEEVEDLEDEEDEEEDEGSF